MGEGRFSRPIQVRIRKTKKAESSKLKAERKKITESSKLKGREKPLSLFSPLSFEL